MMSGFVTGPRIAFGPGAFEQLSAIPMHRVALLADPGIRTHPETARLREEIEKAGASVELLPAPVVASIDAVEGLAAPLRARRTDLIVAIGGGPTLDAAKAAWLRYARPEIDLARPGPLAELDLRSAARLVAVPTGPGSGREANGLVYLPGPEGSGFLELSSRDLEPDWVLLDPRFAASLTPEELAWQGLEALGNACDAIMAEWSSPFTEAFARSAVELLVRELPRAVKRPAGDWERLVPVQAAGTLAGLAVGNAQAGLARALAHALSSCGGPAPGHAVAAVLPEVLEFCFGAARDRLQTLSAALGPGPLQSGPALAARVRLLGEQVGLPRAGARALGEGPFASARDRVVALALSSPSLLGSPRLPSAEELDAFLRPLLRVDPAPGGKETK
jgi:alcohol dehydrogenase class IV